MFCTKKNYVLKLFASFGEEENKIACPNFTKQQIIVSFLGSNFFLVETICSSELKSLLLSFQQIFFLLSLMVHLLLLLLFKKKN